MSSQTHVSARIAASTKHELDEYADAHGLEKGFVIEQALRHYLRALPADVIIPTRIVVTRKSGARVLARIAKPGKPTAALRKLFRKR